MKAVRIHAPGGPEAMRYEDAPEPSPKLGEAVVKVDAAGINYIDVYFRSGQYKADLPVTLGMEAGRTVSAVVRASPTSRSATRSRIPAFPAPTRNSRPYRPRGSSRCRRGSAPSKAPRRCFRA